MKKTIRKIFFVALTMMLLTATLCFGAEAATYTYTVRNGTATITDVNQTSGSYVTIPSYLGGYPVTAIGDWAFAYCNMIENVTIPSTVISIGDFAFFDCNFIKNIVIPDNVKYIGEHAFAKCYGQDSVTIGTGVTFIGKNAFTGCSTLKNIKVDEGNVTFSSDGYGVLFNKNKTRLLQYPKGNKRTTYTVPASVADIDDGAFFYTHNLTSIIVNKNNKNYSSDSYGVLFDKNKRKLIQYPVGNKRTAYSIPNSVRSVEHAAFQESDNLRYLEIGSSVTTIGNGAFGYCDVLESVTIPNSISKIDVCAFDGCYQITDVYYMGTKSMWEEIHIDMLNESLTDATIHCCTVKTTKSTLSKNGKVENKCSVCGKVSKNTIIYYPKSIKLSDTSYTYNGKVKTPSVTVEDVKGKALKKDTDYTVKYESGRKLPGKYAVTITFKGKYSGTKKLYFTVAPITTSKVSATQTTTSVTLKWNKATGVTGYRVFQKINGKWKILTNTTKLTYTIKKLKVGTNYTFAVRPYTVDGNDTILASSYTQIKTTTKLATPTLKVTSTKTKANLSWADIKGETGYAIYMATSKTGKYTHLANYKANSTKATKSKLKSGKTYYFKIRAYKKTSGGTVYSAYSAVKSVKIK